MVLRMNPEANQKRPSIKDGLQDKSLEPLATEDKSAQEANIKATEVRSAPLADIPDEDLPETIAVYVLQHVTLDDDTDLVPGRTVDLPVRLAQRLVSTRRARLVETNPSQ